VALGFPGGVLEAACRALAARRVDGLSQEEFQQLSGRWQPFTPREVAGLLDGAEFPWWIAGGWAAEAAGAPARKHEDTDIAVLHDDLPAVRARLAGFQLWEAHAGSLRPLLPGDELRPEREGLWVRRNAVSPWLCDLLLTPSRAGRWLFKRDRRLSLPLDQLGVTIDGIPYLRPAVVLLHKAKALREKDQQDFDGMLPRLTVGERVWLDEALALAHPDHAWRARLRLRRRADS
jgi:hypothetical protein